MAGHIVATRRPSVRTVTQLLECSDAELRKVDHESVKSWIARRKLELSTQLEQYEQLRKRISALRKTRES